MSSSSLVRRFPVFALVVASLCSSSLFAQDPAPSFPAELGVPSVLPQDGVPDILVATATQAGVVTLFSGALGHAPIAVGAPFGASFAGGLRIGTGDLNDDGIADAIVAMGPGAIPYGGMAAAGGLMRIYSGADASAIAEGFPFGPSANGGLYVAIGDVDGDGHNDIIASEGAGAHVRAFSMASGGTLLADLTPYGPGFTGGVRVATGDVNGDGIADLITAPASGPGTVKVFSTGPVSIGDIVPFDPAFAGGIFVAAGDVDADGRADIVVSAGGGGPGHVRVFRGADGSELFHLGPGLPSNISVATGDLDVDGHADIIAGLGPGNSPMVAVVSGATEALMFSFLADLSSPDGTPVDGDTGVVVASLATAGIRYTSDDHATFTPGQSGTFVVTTLATPTVNSLTETGALPSGITFTDNHDGTATLNGTPAVGTGGAYPLTFTASNSLDRPATQTFTLTVSCVATIAPTSLHNGAFGLPYAPVTFTQTDAAGGTWSATGLPSGLALDPSTGVLSGTPTTTGQFMATITYTAGASCQGSTQAIGFAIVPVALVDTYDAGLGNTQIVAAGHSSPTTPHFSFAASVLANDGGPGLAVIPVTNATTQLGGQITIAANGAFTYTPPVGATGTDFYVYTLTSNGVSSQTAIEIPLGLRRVWYIDPSAAAGDGRSNAPFNSINSVNALDGTGDADDVGDYIYLHAGTHTGSFVSEAGQTLWGAGATFNPRTELTVPASGVAAIQGSITIVGDGVTISSVAVSAATNFGVGAANVNGLTIKNDVTVSTNGALAGVAFQNVNSTPGGAPNFGINFRSVSAQNGQSGISLANVNQTSGSFTITGDGGPANNGSGGVMQNMEAAARLQLARNVSLGYLDIHGFAYLGSGSVGIFVVEGSGTYAVHHTNVESAALGVGLFLSGTTMESFNMTRSRVAGTQTIGPGVGGHGMQVAISETSVVQQLTIADSVFEDNAQTGVQIAVGEAATLTATIQFNTFRGNERGLELLQSANGSATSRVLSNDFQSHRTHAISAVTAAASTSTGLLQLRAQGNTIGTNGTLDSGSMAGDGIRVDMEGNARSVVLIDSNQLHEIPNGRGVAVERVSPVDAQALAADVTVTNNTVTAPTGTTANTGCGVGLPCPLPSFFVQADPRGTGFATVLNVDIHDNSAYNPGNFPLAGVGAYSLRETAPGSLQVVGAGDATTQITTTNTVIAPPGPTPIVVDAGVSVIPGPIVTPP